MTALAARVESTRSVCIIGPSGATPSLVVERGDIVLVVGLDAAVDLVEALSVAAGHQV